MVEIELTLLSDYPLFMKKGFARNISNKKNVPLGHEKHRVLSDICTNR